MSAGVVCALVGFTSSFAVVLTGLRAVGATPAQAASGLVAACVLQGVIMIAMGLRYRMPLAFAWSTPGAAVLAGAGGAAGGWPMAVGAFAVCGVLLAATGFVPALAALVRAIPTRIAQAMLAGVLVPLCLAPVTALAHHPASVAPVLAVWLLLSRFAPRWAVPTAFLVAAVVVGVEIVRTGTTIDAGALVPRLEFTAPAWSLAAITGLAVPLFVATMAAQNIPGVAIMRAFGYRVPWRSSMAVTGGATVLGAAVGVHALNLAAISAALAAGPDVHPDRSRRWIASVTAGGVYLALGAASAAAATLVALAPDGVVQAVAGVALLGTLGGALTAAVGPDADSSSARPHETIAAVATVLTAASGAAFLGVGAAFWALVVGIGVLLVLRPRRSGVDEDAGTGAG
ncbi:benzoate membrane transport protein [Williamsia deligens]|nr:benzoate membrane transport protein [Williamsia deligens]